MLWQSDEQCEAARKHSVCSPLSGTCVCDRAQLYYNVYGDGQCRMMSDDMNGVVEMEKLEKEPARSPECTVCVHVLKLRFLETLHSFNFQ